ncbi:MAG: NADH:flavin oxidoreductase [Deltaproteobacteria bacterium]|nr:MAG: NADH:flavin oxidoreductase [Deltaproteobacteria bacterium]
MSIMFEPIRIKNMLVKNRLARSATYEGMADFEGRPQFRLAELYYRLAQSETGLIFTSACMVDRYKDLPDVPGYVYATAIDEDSYIDDWKLIVEGVQSRDAKIVMQLVHPGRQDVPKLRGGPAPVPSEVPIPGMDVAMKAMTAGEIGEMVEKFAQAARRTKEAGFNGVQLHGGHGYLISNFLSPYMNVRNDEYGGTTENRARLVCEIIKRTRELVGPDFPIMIKMNCDDFVDGGLEVSAAIPQAKAIVAAGIDCIEVTGGIGFQSGHMISAIGINKPEEEAYFLEYSTALKQALEIPIILVGGLRSPEVIERVIRDGGADLVSMCRPFIREPDLIKRWKSGDLTKAACISCGKCSINLFKKQLKCFVEEKLREKTGSE